MKTGIHVHAKCSGKELSQSGVCDDAFLSEYYVNGKHFKCVQRKTACLWFPSPQDNEELNYNSAMPILQSGELLKALLAFLSCGFEV